MIICRTECCSIWLLMIVDAVSFTIAFHHRLWTCQEIPRHQNKSSHPLQGRQESDRDGKIRQHQRTSRHWTKVSDTQISCPGVKHCRTWNFTCWKYNLRVVQSRHSYCWTSQYHSGFELQVHFAPCNMISCVECDLHGYRVSFAHSCSHHTQLWQLNDSEWFINLNWNKTSKLFIATISLVHELFHCSIF